MSPRPTPMDDSTSTSTPAHRAGTRARVGSAVGTAGQLRVVRATQRFLQGGGSILAAGVAYAGLFSLTAALTVGWTVFSLTLRNPTFKTAVIDAANSALPGLFKTAEFPTGLVNPATMEATPATSILGVIALVIAAYSASKVVGYLTQSIRAMFGLVGIKTPVIQKYLRRFLGLIVLLVSLVATAGMTSINTFLSHSVSQRLDFSQQHMVAIVFDIGTNLIPLVADFFVFIVMIRWVAMVRPPRRDLLLGAAVASIGSTGLRLLGTSVVNHVSGPILTAAATLITLAVWINLLATVFLWASAFAANPPLPDPEQADAYQHADSVPNYVTLSAPETLEWNDVGVKLSADSEPSAEHDPRSADHTTAP